MTAENEGRLVRISSIVCIAVILFSAIFALGMAYGLSLERVK